MEGLVKFRKFSAERLLMGAACEFPEEAIDPFARLGRALHVIPCAV